MVITIIVMYYVAHNWASFAILNKLKEILNTASNVAILASGRYIRRQFRIITPSAKNSTVTKCLQKHTTAMVIIPEHVIRNSGRIQYHSVPYRVTT